MPHPMDSSRLSMYRLMIEYETLKNVPKTDLYDWEIDAGEHELYVRNYIVTYHVKTIVKNGEKLEWQKDTTVRLSWLEHDHVWECRVVNGQVPFHANVYADGKFDYGEYDPGRELYEYINYYGQMLQFQLIDINSISNNDAAAFWREHKDDRDNLGQPVFPTDNRPFPVPVNRPFSDPIKAKVPDRIAILYGAPSSTEVSGYVPECMSVKYMESEVLSL